MSRAETAVGKNHLRISFPSICVCVCLFTVNIVLQLIKKDLKKYSKIFEQKDRLSQSKASKVRFAHPLVLLFIHHVYIIFHTFSH